MTNKYISVEEVPAWKKAHELTLLVYEVTKNFPSSETYDLNSQLRRYASSVPANITEGFYRNTNKELLQFLYNSRGSLGETVYFIKLSKDLRYVGEKNFLLLKEGYDDLGKQLNGWIKSLKNKLVNH